MIHEFWTRIPDSVKIEREILKIYFTENRVITNLDINEQTGIDETISNEENKEIVEQVRNKFPTFTP